MIKKWINNWKLKKSNWGREFGWYIEYEEEVIAELVECKFYDMFWDSYEIILTDSKYKIYILDEKLWKTVAFKFRNKFYNQYANNAFAGDTSNMKINDRIIMRGLYLTEIESNI